MKRLYTTEDVMPDTLAGASISVIGYGSQGRAQACNLRDSGHQVTVGLRRGGASWQQACADGWTPKAIAEAVTGADVVVILVADMVQPEVVETSVARHLKPGAMVLFSHGFNVHYEQINLPVDVDVALVAPKSPGALVRSQFEAGRGVPCLFAVHHDATGQASTRALAYAHGIGGTRAGVFATTFAEETETDLFGEQAVLCGGVTELVLAGFETLVQAGYSAEVAYFECLHELKLIVDLLYEGGFARLHEVVSETACFGDLTRGPRIVDAGTRARMQDVLAEIRSGEFAREWMAEHKNGRARYDRLMAADLDHPLEKVGASLRARMSWLTPETQETEVA